MTMYNLFGRIFVTPLIRSDIQHYFLAYSNKKELQCACMCISYD